MLATKQVWNKKITGFTAMLVFFCVLCVVHAEINETPAGTKWYVYAPFHFQGSRAEDDFAGYVSSQGYSKGWKLEEPEKDNDPLCQFDKGINGVADEKDFIGLINAAPDESPGVILITGHGQDSIAEGGYQWIGVEAFADNGAAWDRWDKYYDSERYTKVADNELIVTKLEDYDCYAIFVRNTIAASCSSLEGTECFMHVGTCFGWGFADQFRYEGARVVTGPRGTLYFDQNKTAISTLGQSLAGHEGPNNRAVGSAIELVKDRSSADHYWSGDGNTTLAPCIPAGAPSEHSVCDNCGAGSVDFDTKMKEVDPHKVIDFDGCVDESNVSMSWVESPESHSISFVFDETGESGSSTATVNAQYAVSANNERQLDGNTDEANAEGPNGDDFQWDITCTQDTCRVIP